MILRTFYDRKLAQSSYLIGCESTGEAVIVDPMRQVKIYLDTAETEELQIVGALETHIHADFVSGARELAERTQATLYLSGCGGEDWQYEYVSSYPHRLLREGDSIPLGGVRIQVLHVPGHTPEHLAFLVTDTRTADQPMGIFSGDFLFVGDVGRPDLLESAVGMTGTKESAAVTLFHSLAKLKKLPDFLQVWPGHGAGSVCGKSLGAVPSTTLGYERLFNWAFQIDDTDQFVEAVLEDQVKPPRYFSRMKAVNKAGPALLPDSPPVYLPIDALTAANPQADVIVDARDHLAFGQAHIPGTINIPFTSDNFLTYAGSILPYDRPVAVIAAAAQAPDIQAGFQRVGLDQMAGFYPVESVQEWAHQTGRPLSAIPGWDSTELSTRIEHDNIFVLDVRSELEFAAGHLPAAANIALGELQGRLGEIPENRTVLCQCQSGVRSVIAASYLRRAGFENIHNLEGGFEAWEQAGGTIQRV